MRMFPWILALLAVCLGAVAGCSRAGGPAGPPHEYYGVKVDLPKLEAGFTNASPDIQSRVALVKRAFRYSVFLQALVELDQLSSKPDLTEAQKKLVGDLIEQTKQVIAKAPPPPGQ